jgi:hypothetical protein
VPLSLEGALIAARDFAVELARAVQPVEAVVLIGSLATGDYVPGRSDIDTAVVLDDDVSGDERAAVRTIANAYQHRYDVPKGFGAVRILRSELRPPFDPVKELAPEVLRVKEQGTLLWSRSDFDLEEVATPSPDDLRAYCFQFNRWLYDHRREPDPNPVNNTADAFVNGLLYDLRFAVVEASGRYVLNKRQVIPAFFAHYDVPDLRDRLAHVHEYEVDGRPLPGPEWAKQLRGEVESFVGRLVPEAYARSLPDEKPRDITKE